MQRHFDRIDRLEVSSAHFTVTYNAVFNPLIATLKLQSNRVIGTLAVDGWAVTFGTAMRGLSGVATRLGPSSLYHPSVASAPTLCYSM